MKNQKLFFRVKYGYNTQDKVSIPLDELEKAIYAQVKGTPTKLGNAFVNGKHIISITPDYHKYTGWYESYEPREGDDWKQIKRDCPDFEGVIDQYTNRVKYLIENNQVKLIGQNVDIPQLDTLEAPESIVGVKKLVETMSVK